jgi:RNA polymerase primary sigma factor
MSYGKFKKLGKDSLQLYLKEIARIPTIPQEEEQRLARLIQEKGDRAALKKLVESNLRFVVSFAKKYKDGPMSMADLIEEGNLGLIEAAKRFDPDKGVKFITYAAWWIRQAIIHALGEQGRTIRLPQRQANLLYQLGKHYNELKTVLNRNPTSEELAKDMDISVTQASELMKFRKDDLSLDATIDKNSDLELKDLLAEESNVPVDIGLIRESFREQVREIIDQLNPRERKVIEERFGFNPEEEPKTLQKIGEQLNITRERVRQIEQQAIKKLRRNAKCRKLQTFLN